MADLFRWSMWVSSLPGGVHFSLALACLVLGPIVLLRPKGTKVHRLLGATYILAMLTLNGTALSMHQINGGLTLFHVFAWISLVTVGSGVICIQIYKVTRHAGWIEAHRQFMAWSYFGLVSAGLWQVSMRLLPMSDLDYRMVLIGLSLLTIVLAAGYSRLMKPVRPTISPV